MPSFNWSKLPHPKMTCRQSIKRQQNPPGQVLGVLILLALGLCGCGHERPNVLLISLDTTRADHLGAYGYGPAATPQIDSLAATGFLFHRHLTPVPITLPAHTTLLTGHFPPTHTAHDNGTFVVPADALTLAEVLSEAGYDTAAFVAAFPLSAKFGLNQGFAQYDDTLPEPRWDQRGIFFAERSAGEVVRSALQHHIQRQSQRPFFTFLHFFDPHQPQMPPAPFDFRFRELPYDGEIAYVDEQLGLLFTFLKERGLWDNTLVVLTADHGEGLGEHGELTHAILLHQATLHIPLILRGPGVPHGETREWTSSTQVFATILELVGLPVPQLKIPAGHSLVPLLTSLGQAPKGWPRFTSFFETIAPRTSQGWSQLTGWMKGDWRLIHAPRPELYNLEGDPRESQNLHATEPQIAAHLLTELQAGLANLQTRSVGAAMQTADAETLQQLAALGYLQAGGEATLRKLDDLLAVSGLIDPKDRVADISLYSEAKSATVKGQWARAESLWLEVIRRTPQNPTAYTSLAGIYGQGQDWTRSFAILDQGLLACPEAMDLKQLKGELSIETGNVEQGLALLLELPTDSVRAAVWIGTAHARLGNSAEAIGWYRRGLALDPHNRWLRLYLGNRLAEIGNFTEAEDLFRSLIDDFPYFHLAFYNYGKLLLDRGDRARARPLFLRALQLLPNHQPSLAALELLAAAPDPD